MNETQVRDWIIANVLIPLRGKGRVEVRLRAGDVHKAPRLKDRMPTVCNGMRAVRADGVTMLRMEMGPDIDPRSGCGANVWCTYKLD